MNQEKENETILNELEILEEFSKEDAPNLLQSAPNPPKKSGPWTLQNKEARREETCKLHFDYGFSARSIADFMGVQRNTINSDLRYHYAIIASNRNIVDPEVAIGVGLTRLDIQYARLRVQLDKTEDDSVKLSIERLLLEICSKNIYANHRMAESYGRVIDLTTKSLNDWNKANRKDTRYVSMHDKDKVSSRAYKKIERIIKEDQKIGDPDFN